MLFGYTELLEGADKIDALKRITNEPFKNLRQASEGGEFERGNRWDDAKIPADVDVQVCQKHIIRI